jgi:hypothetical protein
VPISARIGNERSTAFSLAVVDNGGVNSSNGPARESLRALVAGGAGVLLCRPQD